MTVQAGRWPSHGSPERACFALVKKAGNGLYAISGRATTGKQETQQDPRAFFYD